MNTKQRNMKYITAMQGKQLDEFFFSLLYTAGE